MQNIKTLCAKLPPVDGETQRRQRCQQVTRRWLVVYLPGGSAPLLNGINAQRHSGILRAVKSDAIPPPIAMSDHCAAPAVLVSRDVFASAAHRRYRAALFCRIILMGKIFGPGNASARIPKANVGSQRRSCGYRYARRPLESVGHCQPWHTPVHSLLSR